MMLLIYVEGMNIVGMLGCMYRSEAIKFIENEKGCCTNVQQPFVWWQVNTLVQKRTPGLIIAVVEN